MQFTLQVGFAVPFTVAPVDSANNPAKAKISSLTLSSSDLSLFSVGVDPSNPLAGTLTAIAPGTGTFTLQATATEPTDGTQHPVAGAVTITVTAAPIPVPQATALVVTFGTPVSVVPPPPPPPPVG